MRIRMIGTGSAFAKTYYNNNALLHTPGQTLLIDCGITAPMALHQLGLTFDQIDGVLISHIHADHVGGLEEMAFQMKFIYKRKPKLYIAAPLADVLWEHTLKGGLQQHPDESLHDYFDLFPLQAGRKEAIGPLSVELIQTEHIPGKRSYSILLNDTLFYSADMKFNPALLTHLYEQRSCNVYLHDCQLHPPGEVHASLDELLTLPESIQERLWLMHYGDDKDHFAGRTGRMRFIEQHKWYAYKAGELCEQPESE